MNPLIIKIIKEINPRVSEKNWRKESSVWTGKELEQLIFEVIEESIKVMKTKDYHADWLGEEIKKHFK